MKKIYTIVCAMGFVCGVSAQSFIATFPFDNVANGASGTTDPTPVPTVTGAAFSSFSATGTPANPNASGRFSFTDWATGAVASVDVYASHTGSVNLSEYYEVTITPSTYYAVTLDSIAFRMQRSGTGIRTYAVRSSLDGYATNLPASISNGNLNLSVQSGNIFYHNFDAVTAAQDGSLITPGGSSYTNFTMPVTFRFYGWNAEASTGTFSIDNVMFYGTASTLDADFTRSGTCAGQISTFTDASASPFAITDYMWDFGDGSPMAMTEDAMHTYTYAGTYTVTHTVTDASGNVQVATSAITINDSPMAGITGPSSICAGTAAQFLDNSTILSGTITGYDWNFGEPSSGTANTSNLEDPTHTYSMQGVHTVTEIVTSDMGCKDTTTVTIAVDSLGGDFTYITSGGTVDFTGMNINGNGPYTYTWDFGDATTGMGVNVTHAFGGAGTYNVCMMIMDASGCMDVTCQNIVILTTGITAQDTSEISIVPTVSATGIFAAKNITEPVTVAVFNVTGKKISESKTNAACEIDLTQHADGIYFIRISNNNTTTTHKVVLSR